MFQNIPPRPELNPQKGLGEKGAKMKIEEVSFEILGASVRLGVGAVKEVGPCLKSAGAKKARMRCTTGAIPSTRDLARSLICRNSTGSPINDDGSFPLGLSNLYILQGYRCENGPVNGS